MSYSEAGTPDETAFKENGHPFHIRTEGNFQSNNSEAMRTALLSGLGVSRAPKWLVGDSLVNGELVEVLDEFKPDPLALYAVFPPGRHQPSRVRSFIDYFGEEFKHCSMIGGC